MKTAAERRAALDAKHAKELAELELEEFITAHYPLPPARVFQAGRLEPWVTYRVASIAEALPILDAYPPLPAFAIEDGCVYVGPEKRERGTLRFEAPELVVIDLEQIGRSHRSQTLSWWTRVRESVVRIKVEVATWPWRLLPRCDVRFDSYGDVRTATHELPDLGEWKRIKWAAGSRDSCHFALYFKSRAEARAWLEGASL